MSKKIMMDALTYWVNGEWDKLIELNNQKIKHESCECNLYLLIASAYQNRKNFKKAKIYFKKAIELGCNIESILGIFQADMNNSKAKIMALINQEEEMLKSFEHAVNYTILDVSVNIEKNIRMVKELASLGLFLQAKEAISMKVDKIAMTSCVNKKNRAQMSVIKTELELLSHELSLSQMRRQFYRNKNEKSTSKNRDIERLENMSVSQLGQDIWVLKQLNFKKGGFFVEFGATDGVLLSNSFLLEKEFGWQGICAEPNPKFYNNLKKNRDCIVSNECIGATTGEKVKFVLAAEYGGMHKHMSDDMHKDKRQAYLEQDQVLDLETISLNDFLLKHNAPKTIDYLSIDTEGSEYEILENFPFDEWDIKLLTVEHNYTDNREKIFNLLSQNFYTRIEVEWDDWYYKKENR